MNINEERGSLAREYRALNGQIETKGISGEAASAKLEELDRRTAALKSIAGKANFLATGSTATYAEKSEAPNALGISQKDAQALHQAALSGQSLIVKGGTTANVAPAGIADFQLPPVQFLREPTRVRDLMPVIPVSSGTVEHFIANGNTNAAVTAEGATKPDGNFSVTKVDLQVQKIAITASATYELLSDWSSFTSWLQGDMTAAVLDAENGLLLNANTAAASGFFKTGGLGSYVATAGENYLDSILNASVLLRAGSTFTDPDALVINPADFVKARIQKASTAGTYLYGSPNEGNADPTLWGWKVVTSTQVTAGTALLGNFTKGAVVYQREGVVLKSSSGGTDFTSNITRFAAEERVALGILRPSAFATVKFG